MTHALTPQDVWNTLHKSEIFANLTPEEFGQMMSLVQIENIDNGTILFNQHGSDPNLYIIRRGRAAARKAVPGGVDPIVEIYQPGDLINTISFLTGASTMSRSRLPTISKCG
jgi:signal-transduction protein with cAMP-binding, CBS, and nucleotidyltransferase domain